MPLIDLKSNLKNLKFGNDQPGYGSSGLPYIQTKMPGVINPTGTFNTIFRPSSTGNLDYPIRGGNIDFQIGQQTYTLSSKIDQTRIKRFFEDKSRGTAFIQKQVGLQLTNPKMETGNTLFSIGQGLPFSGLLENTRVYNKGINTLAQVGVSGTGAHALRHGLVPFAPLQKHYYAIVNAQNINNEPITNRLVNLNALKMTVGSTPFVNPQNVFDINTVNTLGISLNRNLLFQYLGGPGSAYGIGATTIKRTVDTTKLRSSTAMMYDKIKAQTVNNITNGTATTNIQDFRNQLIDEANLNDPNVRKIFAGRWDPKVISGPTATVDTRFYVSAGNYKDKLNSSYPFLFENSVAPWQINNQPTDDLIKFVFECISNDNPNYSLALFFRAFLTAGITDNNSAELNSFRYVGRGEKFYTYQGFDRSIGFSFRMAAGSRQELQPMYNRLNSLVSQVYPDYSSNNIMRASIVRVTIGDYLYRMPGFLESVSITVDNGYPWEVNLSNIDNGTIAQLPQVVDVAVSFKPIFDELPRRTSTSIQNNSNNTSLSTLNTVENNTISAAAPQLIANNNSVIQNGKIPSIDYTSVRDATPEERAAEIDRRSKLNYQPQPSGFYKAQTARINADKQLASYYDSVKYKEEYFQ